MCHWSFRAQLLVTNISAILLLALISAVMSGALITHRLRSLTLDLGAQVTEEFSQTVALALIAGNAALAERELSGVLLLPGVRRAALLGMDGEVPAAVGAPLSPPPGALLPAGTATAVHEDPSHWHFWSAVRARSPVSDVDFRKVDTAAQGYVHIAWDKAPLVVLTDHIVKLSLAVTLGLAVLLTVVLLIWTKRLAAPLAALAGVMRAVQDGAVGLRASSAGPAEVQRIAHAFNLLLEEVERHRASLEAQVAIRTSELTAARDAALTAVRHKSEFLALITHEMRTPLHAVLGYAQAALEELRFCTSDLRPVPEYLDRVRTAAKELLARINEILELARVEASKTEVRWQATELRPLFEQALETVRPLAMRNGNTLTLEVAGGAPRVVTDPDKLAHIALNLLNNACKFTRSGIITLHVQADNTALVVEVEDTGIGIPEDRLEMIFEPFRQVEMGDTRPFGGTGLGLTITRRFCELLGGAVTVTSDLGRGSCFRVRLPVVPEVSAAPFAPALQDRGVG